MDEFERLYRQHAPAVFRFAWGLCGDRSCAEDLVSETFFRILTRSPRIETRTAVAYLLAVARNAYLSGRRRAAHEVPLTDDLPGAARDPGDAMDDADRERALIAAVRELPESERTPLMLRVDHELPYDEIARVLDISVGAARVRVHRARLRLVAAIRTEEVAR